MIRKRNNLTGDDNSTSPCIISLLIIALLILATPNIANTQNSEEKPYKKLVLSTNLFGLAPAFDDATSNFNVHAEYYLGNRKSITMQAGYLHAFKGSMGNYFLMTGEEINGFQVELEARRYTRKKEVINPLVLIFWFHLFQYGSEPVENSGYYFGTNVSYASIGVQENLGSDFILRDTYAMHLKTGYQCFKKNGLMIDYAIGLGAQYLINSDDFNSGIMDTEGAKIYPSIQYQFRLGFAL